MDWLEEELKQALARKEPAADFDARVRRRTVRTMPRWLAAAAAVIVLAGGAGVYRHHQGERAKEQLLQAMRITGEKLSVVQEHVQAIGDRQ
jgi:type VI protein secretion system component VasF